MSEYIQIYGSNIKLPERPKDEDALNYGLPRKEQKWKRTELPEFFEKVEYNKAGNLLLTEEQEQYAAQEVRRCKEGIWIWIGEKLRYIPKRYYFYLQFYTLEDGTTPEFREADRLYFLFFEWWFIVLWCLGIIRIKKRRQGASSQSCSNILYEAIFFKNSNCGLISKTKEDSKDTFTQMVTLAYRLLPVFLKPKQVNKEDSVTELVFAHKSQTVKPGTAAGVKEEEGHNSRINYKAPVLNAYDRGRMSYVLGDEFGKLPKEVPAWQLLAIISNTLKKGVKRLGWIDLPSTVNEMTKGGGEEYKKIWDASNQFKKKPTTNRIVRFFQPAYEAYEGFIDEFGDSVIGEPTHEQYQYLVDKWVQYNEEGELISELSEEDIKLGARYYVTVRRREGLEGLDLEEEIRMNPCDEDEAFKYAGAGCEFNATNIQNQIKALEDNPPYLRQMRLVPEKKIERSIFPGKKDKEWDIAKPMDDEKGGWFILELPNKPNHFRFNGGYYEPLNKSMYQIGVDTTKDILAVNGSKPVILVFKRSCIIEGEEMGMYPVAMWIADTRLDIHFDEQVLLACKLWGCTANYEIDARGDYYRYFSKENCGAFLEWTPRVAQNPVKKNNKIEPGTRSGDPFQLSTQLQIGKMYVDGTDKDIYNGHVHRIKFITLLQQLKKYDHANRTPYDQCIALFMALLPIFGEQQAPVIPQEKLRILKQYKIKMPA
jgi:hypothetical protein